MNPDDKEEILAHMRILYREVISAQAGVLALTQVVAEIAEKATDMSATDCLLKIAEFTEVQRKRITMHIGDEMPHLAEWIDPDITNESS